MQEFVKKLIERLEKILVENTCSDCPYKAKCDEVQERITDETTDLCGATIKALSIEIVNQLAEEFGSFLYRDANMLLHRETSGNFKTSITLNVREMTLEEKSAFKNVIGLATLPESARRERRVSVTYWNDETLEYCRTEMYMADVTYSIHYIDEEECDIEYNPFTLELTEY